MLDPRPAVAVGCSVVADGLAAAAAVLAEVGIPLAVAGRDLPCPLEVRYPDPATLGVDRWVAAWAAFAEFGASVVVDCGTAVTVDLVDAEGVFLGGAIAPGAETMARGLGAAAPSLPPAAPDPDVTAVPVTSADAVGVGLALGFCGAVERLVGQLAAAGGLRGASRVLTGGGAEVYLRHGSLEFRHVPDLVHRGLWRLWQERGGAGGR